MPSKEKEVYDLEVFNATQDIVNNLDYAFGKKDEEISKEYQTDVKTLDSSYRDQVK
jgi:hypothetical protein